MSSISVRLLAFIDSSFLWILRASLKSVSHIIIPFHMGTIHGFPWFLPLLSFFLSNLNLILWSLRLDFLLMVLLFFCWGYDFLQLLGSPNCFLNASFCFYSKYFQELYFTTNYAKNFSLFLFMQHFSTYPMFLLENQSVPIFEVPQQMQCELLWSLPQAP